MTGHCKHIPPKGGWPGAVCLSCACRVEYQPLIDAAEAVLAGANTGLSNKAIIALYEAVKVFRE